MLRAADAPPLRLDNEPDDIHSDGVQVYLRLEPDGDVFGFLVAPEPEGEALRVRAPGRARRRAAMVERAWAADRGLAIVVTLASAPAGVESRTRGDHLGFDLLVNEMQPDRERRAGQLVWSGGGGWVYLRGDRQAPERFGALELA